MVGYRESTVSPPPDGCPLKECMRFLGAAWTVNVIWYLRGGRRRFSELRGDLAGVSAKTLSGRLRQLERDGLIRRDVRPTSPPTVEYELTDYGRRLLPAIDAIAEVGRELRQRRALAEPPSR